MKAFLLANGPFLLKGALVTLKIWLCSCVIGLAFGTFFGMVLSRRLYRFPLGTIVGFYTFMVRGVPIYVQLLIAYFVVPYALGINPSPEMVAIITLGLCSACYVSEVIRSGVNAVLPGQWDACFVLGYGLVETLYRVIMPQAFRIVLPSLGAEFEKLIKSTSLVSTIGVFELTRTGVNIVARELNPVPVYLTVALLYITLSALVAWVRRYLERRVAL